MKKLIFVYLLFILMHCNMSTIHFCKGERKKFINYVKNSYDCLVDLPHKLRLTKKYHAVYNVLTSTFIFPTVINNLINEYLIDIMIFEIRVFTHYSHEIEFDIHTHNVCINFVKYDFGIVYGIYYYNTIDSLNSNMGNSMFGITKIIKYKSDSGFVNNYISFFNYYMKTKYNKINYIQSPNDESYEYKYINNNTIALVKKYDKFARVAKEFIIMNHKVLTNTIVMIKLIVDNDFDKLVQIKIH